MLHVYLGGVATVLLLKIHAKFTLSCFLVVIVSPVKSRLLLIFKKYLNAKKSFD